jgi:hypothetical protein
MLVGSAALVAAAAVGGAEAEQHAGRTAQAANGSGTALAPRRTTARVQPREAKALPAARLIGDGSTMDTGPQPKQPVPERMAAGQQPPQFVVFSWDGAGEDDNHLFSHFRQVAQETNATMTFFLSGIYTLPRSQRMLYSPPGKPQGASAIGYLNDDHVKATIQQVGAAWLEGHEIGTHFNGHFCDSAGVGTWTPDQWRSEINQAVGFVHRTGRRTPASPTWPRCRSTTQGAHRRTHPVPARPGPAAAGRARSGLDLRREQPRRAADLADQAPGRVGLPAAVHPVPRHELRQCCRWTTT